MLLEIVYYKIALTITIFIFLAFLPVIILDIYYRRMIEKDLKEDAELEKEFKYKDQWDSE